MIIMSIQTIYTNMTDGGGSSSPVENTTIEPTENVELSTPIYLNELLYDTSSYFSASIQDLVDCVLQVKSVNSDIETSSIWDEQVVKEAVTAANLGNISDYMSDYSLNGTLKNGYINYVDTISTDLYSTFENFSEYALGIEYLVALVETELSSSLSPEEYQEFINGIKDNTALNSLRAFSEDSTVGKYVSLAMGRVGIAAGNAMKGPGLAVLSTIKENGILSIKDINHGKLLADGLHNFLTGGEGQVPSFGNRLVSGLGTAAVFFAIGLAFDAANGNLSWENTAVRGAKALVAVGSGMAGTAVTSALAGAGAGSWAGPVGVAVGAAIAVVGNLVINAIVHGIHYTSNDLPREYETVNLNTLKEQMESSSYLASAPRLGPNEEESMYDTCATLLAHGADTRLIDFIEQKVYGYSTEIMSNEDYYHYSVIFQRFRNGINQRIYDPTDMDEACEQFIEEWQWQCSHLYREGDEEYITNLFQLFSSDDSEIKEIFDKILNQDILDDSNFDEEYSYNY